MSVDPGSQKCGLAVVDKDASLQEKMIVPAAGLQQAVSALVKKYPIAVIVMGDRTNSKIIHEHLAVFGLPVKLVDEDRSSIEGRKRYLKEHAKGLARLIPIGLRTPKEAYDDYVAVVLAERFLKRNLGLNISTDNI